MKTLRTSPLDESWPLQDLEPVSACPYCGGIDQTMVYQNVQDWTFGSAPGRWRYWNCRHCAALFLDPRPTAGSIGRAYGGYYTHGPARPASLLNTLKQRLRNEYWSYRFGRSVSPRLGMPRWAGPVFGLLKPWITEPFGLRQLAELPKGLLIDVGCGNGDTLKLASQLGWQSLGIELDPSAVQAAQAQGLNVIQGGYEALSAHQERADCLICSHVLEHVHQPLRLLRLLLAALKPDGVLLLSAPNASSYLRDQYGENWRGLEAPRHLAIPDAAWLMDWLRSEGFQCSQFPSSDVVAMTESERIKRRSRDTLPSDVAVGKRAMRRKARVNLGKQDIVQVVCTRAKA